MTNAATRTKGAQFGPSRRLRFLLKACANVHRPGSIPDIFLFATPRSGSTWLMEIIASQPGIKYYDEPLNPRRENVQYSGLFPDYACLMPGHDDARRIVEFLRALQSGGHRYMNPPPFRRHHRFVTNRIVFKIHEIEHLMDRVVLECSGQLLYLLRHPIANSISRTVQPRLELFLSSDYYGMLLADSGKSREIRAIAGGGSALQRAVVSWCFENLVVFRTQSASRLIVTYEELVLNPIRSCEWLMSKLRLTDRNAMLAAFERPAVNIRMSHAQTIEAMKRPDAHGKRVRLVSKWQERVSTAQCDEVAHVLDVFGIQAYNAHGILASGQYLQFADTPDLLSLRGGQSPGTPL